MRDVVERGPRCRYQKQKLYLFTKRRPKSAAEPVNNKSKLMKKQNNALAVENKRQKPDLTKSWRP